MTNTLWKSHLACLPIERSIFKAVTYRNKTSRYGEAIELSDEKPGIKTA